MTGNSKTSGPRRTSYRTAALLLLLAALLALPLPVWIWDSPDRLPGPLAWECPMYRLTGLPCAGCGMTRAGFAFFHGEIGAAFRCNALFVLPLLAWLAAIAGTVRLLTGKPLPRLRRPEWWFFLLAAAVTVFWLLRLCCRGLRP